MKQIHDITPPRRGIHDIRRPGPRRPSRHIPEFEEREVRPERGHRLPRLSRFSRPRFLPLGFRFLSRRRVLVALLVLLGGFFFVGTFLFAGSQITVVPKQERAFVDATFEAFLSAAPGLLAYDVMRLEKVGSESIPATDTQYVEERASGRIVIFNNYDGNRQRLITNTRFETPDGLIYRINEPVIVPGRIERDGEIIPGSIEVVVYAESPGERHNIGLTDFTIPGFEGSPRFAGFFARSKTAMSGGFIGEKRVVAEEMLEATRKRIETSIESDLTIAVYAEKPEGTIVYPDGLFFHFETLLGQADSNTVEVRVSGSVEAVLFNEAVFASYIAKQTLAGYDGAPVIIENPNDLSFSISEKASVLPSEDESMTFSLAGTARVVSTFDENRLRADLSGRSKEALPTILGGYPSILRAEVTLRPFWRSEFPSDPSEITVRTALDE